MNQTQKNYTLKRVEEIKKQKLQEVNREVTTPGVSFDLDQKLEALEKGEFKVEKTGTSSYLHMHIRFDGESKKVVDLEKKNELTKKIQQQADNICDEIMIGDCERALELLKDFQEEGKD